MRDSFPFLVFAVLRSYKEDQEIISVFSVRYFYFVFYCRFSYQAVLLRGIARGLMAGVARPDVDSISNQSGDTFLLTDVDDDVPSLEEQQASIPASENLESNLQNLESNLSACENSNTTYAAAAASAETPRVNEDETLVSRNYRNELFLSSFERENFHPDNVTPERPCTAYF